MWEKNIIELCISKYRVALSKKIYIYIYIYRVAKYDL